MISRVVIKNFKSIGEPGVDLELKPLTLLVGPNGGGKSSILEAIAVASEGTVSGRLTNFPSRHSVLHDQSSSAAIIDLQFFVFDRLGPRIPTPAAQITFDERRNPTVEFLSQHEAAREIAQRSISELRSNAFLISSVRGDVPFSADAGADPQWVGLHGEQLLSLLAIIYSQRRHERIANRISEWGSRFGIDGLKAGLWGAGRSGSDYMDTELKAVLDLALASSGSRQILTVITQLFWAPEGSLLMIEEPEISLHPKAQIDVLEMFAEAIREENHQIIATSHSVIMLQALGYAVLKGWLTPEQMAVYHVEKGEKGTTATLLPLDEHGYIKDWIPSFTEVERQLIREWAKSVPRE